MKTTSILTSTARIILTSALVTVYAHADVLFQSATLGPTEQFSGSSLDAQYLGVRFHFDSPVQVASIGGHIGGFLPGTLFGAIVSLSSPSTLPSGSPFDMTTVTSLTFTPPRPSADILVPASAILLPGDYALIFGGEQFGATGQGLMPDNNPDLVGPAAYFRWDSRDQRWSDNNSAGQRFVIEGVVVPEPSTWALVAICLTGLGLARIRHRGNRRNVLRKTV